MIHCCDPIAFSIGAIQVRWYGLMYVIGFLIAWLIARMRAKSHGWANEEVDDLVTIGMLACVLGGRVGYILFYDLGAYLSDPLEIVRFWNGGMSFHGAAIGLVLAFFYFAKTRKRSFLDVSDFVMPLVPQGLFFGRIGNYINGELWGKVTDLPWGVIFPGGGPYPRHPSQLYEACAEGLVLFVAVMAYGSKKRPLGKLSGLFALGYGTFRFLIEFVRIPDRQIGYLAFGWLTMGQLLCLPLIAVGTWLLFFFKPKQATR